MHQSLPQGVEPQGKSRSLLKQVEPIKQSLPQGVEQQGRSFPKRVEPGGFGFHDPGDSGMVFGMGGLSRREGDGTEKRRGC